MPFRSKSQARWMFATHPRMAKEWADHTPSIKRLPDKKKKHKKAEDNNSTVAPLLGAAAGAGVGGMTGAVTGGATGLVFGARHAVPQVVGDVRNAATALAEKGQGALDVANLAGKAKSIAGGHLAGHVADEGLNLASGYLRDNLHHVDPALHAPIHSLLDNASSGVKSVSRTGGSSIGRWLGTALGLRGELPHFGKADVQPVADAVFKGLRTVGKGGAIGAGAGVLGLGSLGAYGGYKLLDGMVNKSSGDEFMNGVIVQLAVAAAERPYLDKFAADSHLNHDEIRYLANIVKVPPVEFCKQAYQDPQAFNELVKLVKAATEPPIDLSRLSMPGVGIRKEDIRPALPSVPPVSLQPPVSPAASLTSGMAEAGEGALAGLKPSPPPAMPGAPSRLAKLRGAVGGVADTVKQSIKAHPWRAAGGGVGGLGAGLLGGLALSHLAGGSKAAPAAAPPPMAAPPPEAAPPTPEPGAMGGGGMHPALKGMLAAGGVGAGAYGLSRLLNRGKKKEKQSKDNIIDRAINRAVAIKLASLQEKKARSIFNRYIDKIASMMPNVEKQASLREMQKNICAGKPISTAIKKAYPHLSGEERGILAVTLTRAATKWANDMQMQQPQSAMGPAGNMQQMMGAVGAPMG